MIDTGKIAHFAAYLMEVSVWKRQNSFFSKYQIMPFYHLLSNMVYGKVILIPQVISRTSTL
jgi:hypothetical protein